MNDPTVYRIGGQEYTRDGDTYRALEGDGLRVARQYAMWYLGDPNWADAIIDAYLNPERVREILLAEMGDEA